MSGTTRIRVLLVAALLATGLPTAADTISGTWRSRSPVFTDDVRFDLEAEGGPDLVLRIDADELAGLSLSDLKTTGEPLSFRWIRDAASIRFEGTGRWFGRPSGTFVLEPDQTFATSLSRIVDERPAPRELLRLALHDVSRELVAALAAADYRDVDVDALTRLAVHDVRAGYVEAAQAFSDRPSPDDLVRLRVHGIGERQLEAFRGFALDGLEVADVIRYRNHGINARVVRGMADAGVPADEVDDVIRLRSHGVDAEDVAAFRAVDGFTLSVNEMIRLRNHGVSPEYLAGLAAAGNRSLTVDDVVRMRSHGIGGERYVGLVEAGYPSPDDAVSLTRHGVQPGWIGELAAVGYDGLSVDDLLRLRAHGVGAEFLRRLNDAGHERLPVERVVRYRQRGEIPPPER